MSFGDRFRRCLGHCISGEDPAEQRSIDDTWFYRARKYGRFKDPLCMKFELPLSEGEGPLSRQIYLWLRQAVLLGTIRPGERLPATRDLAEQLHVSRTVVLLAYDHLLAEGFVEGRHGSGTYVSAGLRTRHTNLPKDSPPPRLDP